jgi:hypothetical protein
VLSVVSITYYLTAPTNIPPYSAGRIDVAAIKGGSDGADASRKGAVTLLSSWVHTLLPPIQMTVEWPVGRRVMIAGPPLLPNPWRTVHDFLTMESLPYIPA